MYFMFTNVLNSPNYPSSELQAEVLGGGRENVEPEAGNFIDVASVYRVYHILGGKNTF